MRPKRTTPFHGSRGSHGRVSLGSGPRPAVRSGPAEQPENFVEIACDCLWETDQFLRLTSFSGRLAELFTEPPAYLLATESVAGLLWADNTVLLESDLEPVRSRLPFRGLTSPVRTAQERRFLTINGVALYGPDGKFRGYRGTGVDVTAEVQRWLEAEAEKQDYENVIEAVSEGLALFDVNDRLVLCNKKYREIHKKLGDAIYIGALFENIVRAAASRGVVKEAADRVEEWVRRRMVRHRDPGPPIEQLLDTGRWLFVTERKMPDGGTISVRTDITDLKVREIALKESEARAELANRAKSEFLANMSHELRTPLNAVIGFTEALESGIYGDLTERQRDSLRDIRSAGVHLLGLINDILDISKIESRNVQLREDWMHMDAVIEACLRLVQPQAGEAGVHLETVLWEAPASLWADEQRLKQVVLNLLSNAVKFTPKGGSVTVELNTEPDCGVVLKVIDNGIGMRPEETRNSLEPFYQVESAFSRANHGTGLGLPLAKCLVECHGGTLEVESEIGNGTTVTVRLPMERVRDHGAQRAE